MLKSLEHLCLTSGNALEGSKSGIGSVVQNIRSLQMLNNG